ncbi:MAG: DUF488 domain-containing protein [Planctomycetes bacterium]|nr:DUF488 domain-containing protein [Planctomycetota bacterium]
MTLSAVGPRLSATSAVAQRRRQLLALLHALGGRVGNLDFQKLLFLYCQEPQASGTYEFVPYRFGAFSFTSYADRRKLVDLGLLADEGNEWLLTDSGRSEVAGTRDLWLVAFANGRRDVRGDALVAETYRRFPYYAIRSEIAERVLKGDAASLQRIDAARPKALGSALSTVGYEGRTIESYLNALLAAEITVLCDVRRNPISRKYGFSKSTLQKACDGVGIRYEHLPALGVASEKRRSLDTQADYDALFAEYERTTLPHQGAALAQIRGWMRCGERVALMCFERLPQQCHRHCVAEALERQSDPPLAATHL